MLKATKQKQTKKQKQTEKQYKREHDSYKEDAQKYQGNFKRITDLSEKVQRLETRNRKMKIENRKIKIKLKKERAAKERLAKRVASLQSKTEFQTQQQEELEHTKLHLSHRISLKESHQRCDSLSNDAEQLEHNKQQCTPLSTNLKESQQKSESLQHEDKSAEQQANLLQTDNNRLKNELSKLNSQLQDRPQSQQVVHIPTGFVDDATIATVSEELNLSWRRFGVRLGLKWSKVNKFNADDMQTQRAIENMMNYWRSSLSSDIHQRKMLCTALKQHNHRRLAEELFEGEINENLVTQQAGKCFNDQDLLFICDNLDNESWRRLGVRLGLKWTDIKKIAKNNRLVEDCIMELLVTWRDDQLKSQQVPIMMNALRQQKLVRLAESVRKRHGYSDEAEVPPTQINLPQIPTPVQGCLDDIDMVFISDKLVGKDLLNFGIYLGMEKHEINRIESDFSPPIVDACIEMLVQWRERQKAEVNHLKTISEALNKLERIDIKEELESYYQNKYRKKIDDQSTNQVTVMMNALKQQKPVVLAQGVCERQGYSDHSEVAPTQINLNKKTKPMQGSPYPPSAMHKPHSSSAVHTAHKSSTVDAAYPSTTKDTLQPSSATHEQSCMQELSELDFNQLLKDVSSWWERHGNLNMLKVILSEFKVIPVAQMEEQSQPYSLFRLLIGSGLISKSNVGVIFEVVDLGDLSGVEEVIRKSIPTFAGFKKIEITSFSVHRRNLLEFGKVIDRKNIAHIEDLYRPNEPKSKDQWCLILELEKSGILTDDPKVKEAFVKKLIDNGMRAEAEALDTFKVN
ncbi:uncharacterized protein LOC117110885 [Anneissia japonica]|uniref:uncharacterized protein LOC117110885 n=1 Tax=Anneissia japonica TaxID=1529436 RepID=UPI0014259F69|nr:uncharacterized protein LOC117110885 [Anneissia japonica]